MLRLRTNRNENALSAATRSAALAAATLILAAAAGCVDRPGTWLPRRGDEIVVCGQLFHTGAPVVLWLDPSSYDAYRVEKKFEPPSTQPSTRKTGSEAVDNNQPRYGTWRRGLSPELESTVHTEGWSLERLQQHVDLFVLHYDVCGTARQCFNVLHDKRGLSVQFMLDVDGVIYQTLDLKERAWHAGTANDRSVGVEIANIGAYGDMKTLNEWYVSDGDWPRVKFPPWMKATGVRTTDFVARPARPEPIEGRINGQDLKQYDFTPEQYRSLVKLSATLCRVLPRIKPEVPRDDSGRMKVDVLSDEEMRAFSGIIGHQHVIKSKVDPGPAMNWDWLLRQVRRELRGW